jgi:hypothetical protein
VTKKYKASLEDALDRETLSADISDLATAFDDWETQDGQGTRKLWSFLGKVYELGARIEQNGSVKLDLIEQVSSDPNVANSPKWNPSKKGAHELLLVKFLSLKEETKATKSQWFNAIRAATKSKVATQQTSFIEFLEAVGGVEGARKLHGSHRKPKLSYDELVQLALNFVDPETDPAYKITIPRVLHETPELPGGFGLVLVYGEWAGAKATRLKTIVDQKLIARCIEFLLKAEDAAEIRYMREGEKEFQERAMEIRKSIKVRYAQYKKGPYWKNAKLDFSEFVEKIIDEDEYISEQNNQIPELSLRIEMGRYY